MPIFRDTSTVGVPRKWSLSDEDLKLVDTELVHFYSDGSRLAGDIYKPKNVNANDKYPAIVLVDGFTGIKEVYQVNYAVAFAKAGYVCICFDYRGYGESDGQRGRLYWDAHVEDVQNAITFMEYYPGVDRKRIGLWGTSYGGAVMPYVLGIDDRAKACVAQVGFGDGGELAEEILSPDQKALLKQMLEEDRKRRVLHNDPIYVCPIAITGHPAMSATIEETKKDFPQIHGREAPIHFLAKNMSLSPISVIHKKGDRALMCIAATKDDLTTATNFKRMFDKAPEPKEWIEYNCEHYDIYEGKIYDECLSSMIKFYKKYV
jgi:pimeloyl-ACP methyl ester carboxylesterase